MSQNAESTSHNYRLSPGTLSQPSTAPHAANLRAEKQRARGLGWGRLREKTAETEKLRNKEMKKRGGMNRKEPGPGESIRSCVPGY